MNKFNLLDEVFYLDFHKHGVDITAGVITGMKVASVIDHRGHIKKNKDTGTEYLINQVFYKADDGEGVSYDLGEQCADTIFCNKVFSTYEDAFKFLNNYVQEKNR